MADDDLGELEHEAWRGFLRTHERLWRALESRLSVHGLSIAEYDVLLALDEAGPEGLRMSDLAHRRLMTSGGFTRLADRLESRALIERRRSAADGRSLTAVMTRSGTSTLVAARTAHHRDVRELFSRGLSAVQLSQLVAIWASIEDVPEPGTRPGTGGNTLITGDPIPPVRSDSSSPRARSTV